MDSGTRINGMTLLELLTVLAISALLMGLSLPGFSEMINSKRGELAMARLAQAIQLARVAAITESSLVTLCRSSDGRQCKGQWQEGILIFSDAAGDRRVNHEDRIIRHIRFPELKGSLRWRAFQNRQYLQITPQGFTRYQNGNFTYCPEDGNPLFAQQLIINRTARTRLAVDKDGDGIKEDSRGRALRCR